MLGGGGQIYSLVEAKTQRQNGANAVNPMCICSLVEVKKKKKERRNVLSKSTARAEFLLGISHKSPGACVCACTLSRFTSMSEEHTCKHRTGLSNVTKTQCFCFVSQTTEVAWMTAIEVLLLGE